jgi:hypothetical protein
MIILFFLLGVSCLAIRESLQSFRHDKTLWSKLNPIHFFGERSDLRKYKHYGLVKSPNTWYYRTFKIEHKERFPLSATALVFLTDGFHLMLFMAINFFTLAIEVGKFYEWLPILENAFGGFFYSQYEWVNFITLFIWLRLAAALLWWFLFEVLLKKR